MPSYLIDRLHLTVGRMGVVMSAIGFGAAMGTLLLPWLSDRTGRRPVMLLSTIGATVSLLVLSVLGPRPGLLFAALFMVHFFNNSLIMLTVGPVCAETVPPGLMATASGVVIAIGELFGGGVAPIIARLTAERFGIGRLLVLPVAAMACGFVLCLFLREQRSLPAGSLAAPGAKSE